MRDLPVDSLTLATFRLAELGFLGVLMSRRVTTPFFCGQASSRGERTFADFFGVRLARMDWLMVRCAAGVGWKDRCCCCARAFCSAEGGEGSRRRVLERIVVVVVRLRVHVVEHDEDERESALSAASIVGKRVVVAVRD